MSTTPSPSPTESPAADAATAAEPAGRAASTPPAVAAPVPTRRAFTPSSTGPWPTRVWLPLSLVRPVLAVRASDHAGWLISWAVHLAGLLLGVVVVMLLEALNSATGSGSPVDLAIAFSHVVDDWLRAWTRSVFEAGMMLLGAVAGVLFIHAGTVVAAVGLMAWTATGHEPARASWTRTMQRLWRLTPFAAVMMLAMAIGVELAEGMINVAGGRSWWWSERLMAVMWLVSVAWPITVVLWALTPRATPPCCRWPAGCERCGYALLGLGLTQTCPECGEPVARSVDPARRPGPPWTRPDADVGWAGLIERWWNSITQAIFRPTRLGQSLHLLAPGHAHRRFFAGHLGLAVLSGFPGIVAMFVLIDVLEGVRGRNNMSLDDLLEVVAVAGPVVGTFTLGGMAVIFIGGAGVVGGLASWLLGRNLLPAAQQAASYLAGYALAWIAIMWGVSMGVMILGYILFEYLELFWNNPGLTERIAYGISLGILGLNVLLLAGYLVLLARITRAAKHANW